MTERINRDRPAKNPGGMQCERCDEIFIGEEWHMLCAICARLRDPSEPRPSQTHFEDFVDHILSDDDSELGKTKAELNYALHCLEREIAICSRTQAQNDALVKALESVAAAKMPGEARRIAVEALRASGPDLAWG